MITLTVVSYNNEALAPPMSATFGKEGGTLGRSIENDFVLPDSRNLVSRTQGLVKSDGVRHTITNLSRATPILLNGREIDTNCEYPLKAEDEIQIGLYLLRAEVASHEIRRAENYAPAIDRLLRSAPLECETVQPIDEPVPSKPAVIIGMKPTTSGLRHTSLESSPAVTA